MYLTWVKVFIFDECPGMRGRRVLSSVGLENLVVWSRALANERYLNFVFSSDMTKPF